MKLEKIDKNIIDNINLEIGNEKEIYAYKNIDNEIIGIVIISDDDNILKFYILEQYQNKGYGKKMVKEALEILKMKGYEEISFIIERHNIKAIKIITSLGGIHLSNIENLSKYIITL